MKKQRFRRKTATVCRAPDAEPGSGFAKGLLTASITAILLALSCPPVVHADVAGVFEMDGDGIDDLTAPDTEDDWNSLIPTETANSDALEVTFLPGGRNGKLFTEGSKDIDPLVNWRAKVGSVTPGNDIMNAFAGAYSQPGTGDTILVCGMDRYTVSGAFALGCTFFKDDVSDGRPIEGGGNSYGFYGIHMPGDVQVTALFGGSGILEITASKWIGNDATGHWETVNTGVTDFNCDTVGEGNTPVCGNTNLDYIDLPWANTSDYKAPVGGLVPPGTFIEIVINLNDLFGDDAGCFSSFMMSGRTSPELGSSLKEYAIGDFNLCEITMDKECAGGVYDPIDETVDISARLYAKNTGAATVKTVTVVDNQCTADTADDVVVDMLDGTAYADGLPSDATVYKDVSCSIGLDDLTLPTTNVISEPEAFTEADGEGTAVAVVYGDIGPGDHCTVNEETGSCASACDIATDPSADLDKKCVTRVVAKDGEVVVKVGFNGYFENTSDTSASPTPLTNIKVCDTTVNDGACTDASEFLDLYDSNGIAFGVSDILNPGARVYFDGEYFPSSVNSPCPGSATFMNTVEATADDAITGTPLGDGVAPQDTATCDLCPDGGCAILPVQPLPAE